MNITFFKEDGSIIFELLSYHPAWFFSRLFLFSSPTVDELSSYNYVINPYGSEDAFNDQNMLDLYCDSYFLLIVLLI